MRRTKLVWFALGAATSAAIFLCSSVLNESAVLDGHQVAYLVLTEPTREILPGSPVSDDDMIAYKTGQVLKDCGVQGFETTGMYEDHRPTVELPIVAENTEALECVIKAVGGGDIPFKVEMRWNSAVTNEMRTER